MFYQFSKKEIPDVEMEISKLKEEIEEFRFALRTNDIDNLIEEGLDIIQVLLNLFKACDWGELPKLKRPYGKLLKVNILEKDLEIVDRRFDIFIEKLENQISRQSVYKYLQKEVCRAIISVVLEIFEANNISEEMLRQGIDKHNQKLRGRGWTLEPIEGVKYE